MSQNDTGNSARKSGKLPDGRVAPGKGPMPGSGGRPREEWKRELEGLLTSRATVDRIQAAMEASPDDEQFWKAMNFVADRIWGKPSQSVDVTSGGEKLTVSVERK